MSSVDAGTIGAASAPRLSRAAGLLALVEVAAPRLLAAATLLWVGVVFAASIYKYETFGQGYDQVDFEQAIWNTVQGRPMEDSRFNFTWSIFGMDWMPMLLFFVPAYALIPSAHTLFFLQIVGAAAGVVPLYRLAIERLGSATAGLAAGTVYLLYPVLLHGVLNPFQVRLFAVTLLLFAFYYFDRARWVPFTACALLAMLARTDVALVVAMFGVYGLVAGRGRLLTVLPLALGLGYFALSTFVIVPSFAYPSSLSGGSGEVSMDCWPCGVNPMIAYYGHLGRSGPEIIGYILTHPVEVAQLVLQVEKLQYLVALLLPLAFLPLLAPRPLILCLPILALNLLSTRSSQYDIEHHYSLLLIPGLLAATIYGAGNLRDLAARHRGAGTSGEGRPQLHAGALGIVLWAILMNIPYKNPIARVITKHEPPARVAAAHELIRMVPPEAKVAASSFLAPHLLPRRHIYNFPPAPYSPYRFATRQRGDYVEYVELDYILVDPRASALEVEANKLGGKTGLEWLQELPEWEQIASQEGLLLFRRR